MKERSSEVKLKIGTGTLTKDLVWCECGRGISLIGRWLFCPTCGGKIDQESYVHAVGEALANGGLKYMEPEIFALQQEVERLTQRLEQSKKLYEMTLANEMDWMKKWDKAQADCVELRATLRTSLAIPKAWMRGHITFEQWDAACQKVFDAIDNPSPGSALLASIAARKG